MPIERDLVKAHNYKSLEDSTLRNYLESKAPESCDCASLDSLADMIKKELKIDMSDSRATSRMQNTFN